MKFNLERVQGLSTRANPIETGSVFINLYNIKKTSLSQEKKNQLNLVRRSSI